MSFLRIWTDEKGNPSSARVLLWLWTLVVIGVIISHVRGVNFDQDLWPFLQTTFLALVGWAGGPRVMEYLTGAVSNVAGKIGSGKQRQYGPREQDV